MNRTMWAIFKIFAIGIGAIVAFLGGLVIAGLILEPDSPVMDHDHCALFEDCG
jgi:hypothetical protein